MHQSFQISKNQKNKQAFYKLCDHTKGGTDIVDQKITFYSCKTKFENVLQMHFCICLTLLV